MMKKTLFRAVLFVMGFAWGYLVTGYVFTAHAGSTPTVTVNGATTGSAGTKVVISNSTATKLLAGNPNRLSWTAICVDTTATAPEIAAMCMPGGSNNTAASPAPSATVGFPLMANTYLDNEDFGARGLDSLHDRLDCFGALAASTNCYTWEQ